MLLLLPIAHRDNHLQPDLETYNNILRACLKGEQWTRASYIMDQIRVTGRRGDQETWELYFKTCVVCNKWDAAVQVLDDMFAEEVRAPMANRK